MDYFYIGLGGIFGALSRYGISKWIGRKWPGSFPRATFVINMTGSFALGLLYILFLKAGHNQDYLKNIVATGFLGAFTTYSTFSYEIIGLIQDGEFKTAARYFLFSLVLGIFLAFAGIWLAEYINIVQYGPQKA